MTRLGRGGLGRRRNGQTECGRGSAIIVVEALVTAEIGLNTKALATPGLVADVWLLARVDVQVDFK